MELEAEIESLKQLNQDLQTKQVFVTTIFCFSSDKTGPFFNLGFSMLQAEIMKSHKNEVKFAKDTTFPDTLCLYDEVALLSL